MNPNPAIKRQSFCIDPRFANEVEVDSKAFEDLPPHKSLSAHLSWGYASPRWILETLSAAVQQGSFVASHPLTVLSMGTGGNAYEELNALLHLTEGKVGSYLGIEIDPKRIQTDHQMLKGIPFARSTYGDAKNLDSIVTRPFDIALIRNPQLKGNQREDMYTWGMATQKLKPYLTKNSLLVITTTSEREQVPVNTILSTNGYQEIKFAANPSPSPLFGIDRLVGTRHHYDKYITTARR